MEVNSARNKEVNILGNLLHLRSGFSSSFDQEHAWLENYGGFVRNFSKRPESHFWLQKRHLDDPRLYGTRLRKKNNVEKPST